jgi:hypothetical protein
MAPVPVDLISTAPLVVYSVNAAVVVDNVNAFAALLILNVPLEAIVEFSVPPVIVNLPTTSTLVEGL